MKDANAPDVLKLTNDSVVLYGYSAIFDEEKSQLVAFSGASTAQQTLQAIFATLATNSKQYLTLRLPHRSVYLTNIQRGPIRVSSSLMKKENVAAHAQTFLHPAAGDPRLAPEPYFYVVNTVYEKKTIREKLCERLNMAIVWPVLPTWADYIWDRGEDAGLIESLPCYGPDFISGLRVDKNDGAWESIIQAGFESNTF